MTSFRDSVASFKALWDTALDDTVTVRTNAAGGGTYNPTTRTYDGTATVVYTGDALVRPRGASTADRGEQLVEVVAYDIYLPSTATGLAPDQQVTVDATGTASPELTGEVLTVREIEVDSFNAHIRLGCELNRGAS